MNRDYAYVLTAKGRDDLPTSPAAAHVLAALSRVNSAKLPKFTGKGFDYGAFIRQALRDGLIEYERQGER